MGSEKQSGHLTASLLSVSDSGSDLILPHSGAGSQEFGSFHPSPFS